MIISTLCTDTHTHRGTHTQKTINSSNMDFNLLLYNNIMNYILRLLLEKAPAHPPLRRKHTVTVQNQFINHLINLLFTQKPDQIVLLERAPFVCWPPSPRCVAGRCIPFCLFLSPSFSNQYAREYCWYIRIFDKNSPLPRYSILCICVIKPANTYAFVGTPLLRCMGIIPIYILDLCSSFG